MTALTLHLGYEFRAAFRSPSLLLLDYLFPIAFYVLMGLVMIPLNPDFASVMLPAMTIFAVMTPTVLGLPGPHVDARELGVFRGFRVNGISTAAILGVPAVSTAGHALIVAAVVGATATPLFGAAPPARPLALVAMVLLATFVFTGFGLLFGVVSSDSRMTVIWSQAIFLPSMLIGGLMVPVSLLPPGMQPVAMLLPTTQLMNLAEGWAYQRVTPIPEAASAIALLASGLIAFVLAFRGFSWEPGTAERRIHPAATVAVLAPLAATIAFL